MKTREQRLDGSRQEKAAALGGSDAHKEKARDMADTGHRGDPGIRTRGMNTSR